MSKPRSEHQYRTLGEFKPEPGADSLKHDIRRAISNAAMMTHALMQIEQISDNCVCAEQYTAEDALNHLQGIRNIIKGLRADLAETV